MKIDNWRICHWPILAVYLKKILLSVRTKSINENFVIENYDHCFDFVTVNILRLLFGDCPFIYFHSLMKLAFLVSKRLLCLYDKQNNTWLLVDMEFLFSCSTRHLTRSLRSLVSYRVKPSKRTSISMCAHVLFSIYHCSDWKVATKLDWRLTRESRWHLGVYHYCQGFWYLGKSCRYIKVKVSKVYISNSNYYCYH